MFRLIKFELYKMSRRPRTYLGFAAFTVFNFLALLGVKYGGAGQMAARQASVQGFEVIGSPANGELLAWAVIASPMAIPTLTMFMPFFVSLIFGEIFSGESSEGTLRTVLSRPVKRSSLFGAKFAASMVYAAVMVLFVGLSAYVMGLIAFGRGGLMSMGTFERPMITFYGEAEGLTRLGLAYVLTAFGMAAVGMFAFLISTWLGNSLGAVGAAVMLLFTMFILGEIPYFKPIKDYLLSTNLLVGQKAFLDPIPWGEIRASVAYIATYIVALLAAAMLIFRRKDILT